MRTGDGIEEGIAVGLVITVVAIAFIALGSFLMLNSIRKDCLNFGAFVINGDKFDCSIHTVP